MGKVAKVTRAHLLDYPYAMPATLPGVLLLFFAYRWTLLTVGLATAATATGGRTQVTPPTATAFVTAQAAAGAAAASSVVF